MSVWAQSWAYEQRAGSAGAKAVLVALAVFADEDGFCYPSQERIAGMTEQGERTVRAHLVSLERAGLISRERRRRPDGTYLNDGFALLAPAERLRRNLPMAKSAGGYPVAIVAAGEDAVALVGQGIHPAAKSADGESRQRQKTAAPAADSAKNGVRPPKPPYKELVNLTEPSEEPSIARARGFSPQSDFTESECGQLAAEVATTPEVAATIHVQWQRSRRADPRYERPRKPDQWWNDLLKFAGIYLEQHAVTAANGGRASPNGYLTAAEKADLARLREFGGQHGDDG